MDQKKMAAALTAVNMYLAEEARETAGSMPPPPAAAWTHSGAWHRSGRESIMNLGQLVTLRLWRR